MVEEKELGDYEGMVLFTYSINNMAYKDKVRFYYALKGRDGKGGMLAKQGVHSLAGQSFSFLKNWQKSLMIS